jgi:diguanylate cyclase (GGDEF)-like protein
MTEMHMPRPKVLVVDDTRAKLIHNRIIISKLDCEVIEATSGEAALAAFEQHEFAVVVLDIQMPGMDGFQVAEAIASHARGRQLPIIFSTATYLDDANRIKAYGIGAVDYLLEPSHESVLLSKVRVFLELYRGRQELAWLLSERTRLEELARHEASHDSLTGLPNRRLYMDRLEQGLAEARSRGGRFAVFYMDLDDFKPVNDRFGHPMGDALLKAVAQRVGEHLTPGDTVARFGGDEFAGILRAPASAEAAVAYTARFAQRLREPYPLLTPTGDTIENIVIGV